MRERCRGGGNSSGPLSSGAARSKLLRSNSPARAGLGWGSPGQARRRRRRRAITREGGGARQNYGLCGEDPEAQQAVDPDGEHLRARREEARAGGEHRRLLRVRRRERREHVGVAAEERVDVRHRLARHLQERRREHRQRLVRAQEARAVVAELGRQVRRGLLRPEVPDEALRVRRCGRGVGADGDVRRARHQETIAHGSFLRRRRRKEVPGAAWGSPGRSRTGVAVLSELKGARGLLPQERPELLVGGRADAVPADATETADTTLRRRGAALRVRQEGAAGRGEGARGGACGRARRRGRRASAACARRCGAGSRRAAAGARTPTSSTATPGRRPRGGATASQRTAAGPRGGAGPPCGRAARRRRPSPGGTSPSSCGRGPAAERRRRGGG